MDNNKVSVYITGDTHRHWVERLSYKNFPESRQFDPQNKANTYIIICGDFGIWEDSREEKYNLSWLLSRPYTVCFVDGNHENFDRLYQFPVEEWHGGKIHRISDSVIHLMRGQVFDIGNRSFFTFGGARSHDCERGILNPADPDFNLKKKRLIQRGERYFRILGQNIWEQELPNENELEEGIKNLSLHHNSVDYIISHCTFTSAQHYITGGSTEFKPDVLTNYFEKINETVRYNTWFFGHYHKDTPLIRYNNNNIRGVFENIIKLF